MGVPVRRHRRLLPVSLVLIRSRTLRYKETRGLAEWESLVDFYAFPNLFRVVRYTVLDTLGSFCINCWKPASRKMKTSVLNSELSEREREREKGREHIA